MADPGTRIVSLTVTEGGYNFHPVTGEFDEANPAVQADLAPGAVPATTFGLITEALMRRRTRGVAPFTIMSCDNIQGNGHVAQEVFTAFARLREPELGEWSPAPYASRTPWWTGSPPSPPTTTATRFANGSASRTPGRWCANPSPSGCWRTSSPSGGPLSSGWAFRWFPTLSRTS